MIKKAQHLISCDDWYKKWQCSKIYQELVASSFIKKKEPDFNHIRFLFPWPVQIGSLLWRLSMFCMCNEQRWGCLWIALWHYWSNFSSFTSLLEINITLLLKHVSVNISTRCQSQNGSIVSATMDIMVSETLLFLLLWRWKKWMKLWIITKLINLYPPDDTVDDADLHLLCSTLHICMVDWYYSEDNFWPMENQLFTRKRETAGR